jgi:carboxyl-terminal processing protease
MSSFVKFQKTLATFLIVIAAFFGGLYTGKSGFDYEIKKNPPRVEITNKYPNFDDVDFSLFWQIWQIVENQYLDRPVDPQKMVWGAIEGMVSALEDPYTSFLPPSVNEVISNAIDGTYEGIGAELGMEEGQLMIVAPLDGSPAKAAGVRAGDKILQIEGISTLGISIGEAVSKIRGEAGTVSALTLQRGHEDPFVVHIKRGKITVKSVTWEDKGDGTAYIRISRFGSDTNDDWDTAVSEINISMTELDAVIVDVRGNPGGYLLSAVHIAGEFFKNKPVVFQEDSLGHLEPLNTSRIGIFNKTPVFVLIDGGSASASEILAAALKHHVDAVLVGVTSFGKGTIQDAQNFSDGSGLHLTIAKWLTPAKEWVHGEGISPDVEVILTREDIEAQNDLQLEKALELAKEL